MGHGCRSLVSPFKSNFVISEPQPCGHKASNCIKLYLYLSIQLSDSKLPAAASCNGPGYCYCNGPSPGYWLELSTGYWLEPSCSGWLAGWHREEWHLPWNYFSPCHSVGGQLQQEMWWWGQDRTGAVLARVMVWEDRDSRTHEEGGTGHGI